MSWSGCLVMRLLAFGCIQRRSPLVTGVMSLTPMCPKIACTRISFIVPGRIFSLCTIRMSTSGISWYHFPWTASVRFAAGSFSTSSYSLSSTSSVFTSLVPSNCVAWLGVHLSVMLEIFWRCPSNISDTIFRLFLCRVLFPMNTSASSSFPCCIRLRFSSIFLMCCFSDLLDHYGILDNVICIFLAHGSLTIVILAWFTILSISWSSESDNVGWNVIFLNLLLQWFSCWTKFVRCKV